MKKILIAVIAVICGTCNAASVAELFIKNVPGVTDQDISMCQSSYVNGGKYFHHFNGVKLTCERRHISVDFDREE